MKKKGASILLLNSTNKVLLALRDDKEGIPFPNKWDLLGGNVEKDETPQQCIVRELREEIEFNLNDPALFNAYDMDDRVEYMFWKNADIDIQNTPLHEGQKLRWFSAKEIERMPENEVAFGFRSLILDFFRSRKTP